MHLFNASSMITEESIKEVIKIIDEPEKLEKRIIEAKMLLQQQYYLKVYNLPEDFTTNSYVIASNHLTDSDAPLFMSYYYEIMHAVKSSYPELFVFAKENCFNGVSIPKELSPILKHETVFSVDRGKAGGAVDAMRAAREWFQEGEQPKHFLNFAQGTIYDINKEKAEDIEKGAFWLAKVLGIPVLPAFIEQAIEGEENRIIFDEPIVIPKNCRDFEEYKQLWIDRVIKAQNSLAELTGTPARETVLDAEHQVRKRFKTTEK